MPICSRDLSLLTSCFCVFQLLLFQVVTQPSKKDGPYGSKQCVLSAAFAFLFEGVRTLRLLPCRDITSKMGIKFYSHDLSPPCRAVRLTLKHLGVDFELCEVDFMGGGHHKPEYLDINLRGKIPGLDDDGLKMGESRAIMQYLCNQYEKPSSTEIYPKNPKARAVVDQLVNIDSDAVQEYYKFAQPFEVLVLDQQPSELPETGIRKYFEIYETFLSKSKYLAGDHITIADLTTIASITILDLCNFDNYGDFPKLRAWLQEMRSLAGFDECIGGPSEMVKALYQSKVNPSK